MHLTSRALMTLSKPDIDSASLGLLDEARFLEIDRAVARALDIRRANLPT